MKLMVSQFLGENRALHEKLLPATVGVRSLNHKPGSGDFRPWRSPSTVATVPAGRQTIYRMGRDVASDARYWLSWTGIVHAVRGFDPDDTTERTYYTGDGVPKVTDNLALDGTDPQVNPAAPRLLGVPAPVSAPIVTTDAGTGTGDVSAYYYVYTYVTDRGEESSNSPVSAINNRQSDLTATLSGFAAPPAGNYGITLIRIYRTQTGSSGTADFFFLREIAVATPTTSDDGRALGETLSTSTWLMPPADLSNLTTLWNGMLAGISGNAVRFCESYVPYAWPIAYDTVPPDGKPVGLGVFGQSLLVLTTGRPVLVTGSTPDAMDATPLEIPQGCVSSRSVVGMGSGVAWASNDGLCFYGTGGARILTAGIMTRANWQALNPASITGCMYEGLYFGSYDDGTGRKGFMVDPSNTAGIYFLSVGYPVAHFDELQDQLYVLNGVNVQRWDAGEAMTATFRSKVFHLANPSNMVCGEVVADTYPVTMRVYADGVLKFTKTVPDARIFKLPAGFKNSDWQLEIETTGTVQSAALATSIPSMAATA
ncbi:hypothetical protein RD110_15570 [Rhodoferax koreense]|uniref:Uncharacterized protein n=1 Tax=Rhodoferax koreensis TaxID=1842727 RepID=A0A1P8JXL8_9BURK|nr:hypothetical protein [Rhodoferax koreense]APW38441.1 hypothetical protein RD110_15570 [Rhodoferax koreense]